ncbi:hypothetical protein PSA7680_01430 [Pseudoruegeria aquimaris]|uniref:Transglycosylase associated protein n=1 Tax=Pseudoruegeria aquimaris TaxID=393663 RepID=A0A1Y5S339_9RHOB|nr:GlsB/YeaQ/YmgE family stress response membrane protein [Pseudoruegeria aquimaris]SLN30130.1 hypothetical protein PSA7680_01430 [Pseudoruegeria aquimaris]
MSVLVLIIVGAAAGFLATRLMEVETDTVTTIAIGVVGALLGGLILRLLGSLFGMLSGFVGAVLGAMLLLWIWKQYQARR